MEDLFTAVLSPGSSQSSQLQPPNTIPSVPVMTVPQQGPGTTVLHALNRKQNNVEMLYYDLLGQLNLLGF